MRVPVSGNLKFAYHLELVIAPHKIACLCIWISDTRGIRKAEISCLARLGLTQVLALSTAGNSPEYRAYPRPLLP